MKNHLFNVIVNDTVAEDIQEAVNYYNKKQMKLGTRFYNAAKKSLKSLEHDALLYQVKYKDVRCIKVKNFPYLIHYKSNEKSSTVRVYALICTHNNPDDNWIE